MTCIAFIGKRGKALKNAFPDLKENILQGFIQSTKESLKKGNDLEYMPTVTEVKNYLKKTYGKSWTEIVKKINLEDQTETINTNNYGKEFTELQERSNRLSESDIRKFHSGKRVLSSEDRTRISGVFRKRLAAERDDRSLHVRTDLKSEKHGTTFSIIEKVDGNTFYDIFKIVRNYLPKGELVDLHDNYDDIDCYISEDGLSGFAVEKNGNLISVFNLSDKRGFLYAIKDYVKEKGANHLDGYNSPRQPLAKIYAETLGWSVASMMDYNMEYDHDDIAKNHDNPQIAFMVDANVETKNFDKNSYDEAQAYQLSVLNTNQDIDEEEKSTPVEDLTRNLSILEAEDILSATFNPKTRLNRVNYICICKSRICIPKRIRQRTTSAFTFQTHTLTMSQSF